MWPETGEEAAAPGHNKARHLVCKKPQTSRQSLLRPVGCSFTFPRAFSRTSLRHAPQAWGCTAQRYQALRVNIMWVLCAMSHFAWQKPPGQAGHGSLRRIIHIMCKYRWAIRSRQAAKSAFYLPRPTRRQTKGAPARAKAARSSVSPFVCLLPSAPKGAPQKTTSSLLEGQANTLVACLLLRRM
jgi:hypothetical protein